MKEVSLSSVAILRFSFFVRNLSIIHARNVLLAWWSFEHRMYLPVYGQSDVCDTWVELVGMGIHRMPNAFKNVGAMVIARGRVKTMRREGCPGRCETMRLFTFRLFSPCAVRVMLRYVVFKCSTVP